jgi:hypothetical protein
MPIWLRNFTFNKLKADLEPQEEAPVKTSNVIHRPETPAHYTTKASTK